ncbi:MAG: hypothetical protein ACYDER_18045 [Ktedonobacteraceae bacterium]
MKEHAPQLSSDELNSLFAQLNPFDVEQFYTAYQLWSTRQRIQTLQALTDAIQRDITENTECLEQVHPSALALATLARLQAHGVSNIAVLDLMLERGEEWLDRTMQRLEYCEKIDVISGDYTKWCEHALEGAYDWIDSMQGQDAVDFAPIELPSSETAFSEENGSIEREETRENSEPANEIMEELFLQKLMSDDTETIEATDAIDDTVNAENIEDEASMPTMLDTTLKMRAVSQPAQQETPPDTGDVDIVDNTDKADDADNTLPAQSELPILPTRQETRSEEVESTPVLEETQAEHTTVTMMAVEKPEELQEPQPQNVPEQSDEAQAVEHMDVLSPTEAPIINYGNTSDQVAALPPTGTPTRRKKGVVRTLLAVLFHV